MKFSCSYSNLVDISKLVPNPKNANRHSIEQIKRLAKIIDFQGQRAPIVVSRRSGFIVKGHCRLEALKELGWSQAAVDFQDYETEAQEYADLIADNEIARWAELDLQSLHIDLEEIEIPDIEMLGLKHFSLEVDDIDMNDGEDEREYFTFNIKCTNVAELAEIQNYFGVEGEKTTYTVFRERCK